MKTLLKTIFCFAVSSASVFGMYGFSNDWMDFLTDSSHLRARTDQLGFVLGNSSVKGTLGFKADTLSFGNIMSYVNNGKSSLDATVSLGLAYTSDIISIGLGYNYTYIDSSLDVHTPVFMINAMNDSLRICMPFQIADSKNNSDYSAFSTDTEIRYYTGLDSVNAVRLYINYGKNNYGINSASSFGLELRFYFLPTTINDVWINPFIKVLYYSALDAEGKDIINKNTETLVNIKSHDRILYTSNNASEIYESNPYILRITPALSLYADSDFVTLYFEPSIGYKIIYDGKKVGKLNHALTWGAYSEVRIHPVKDLEWYFEMGINS
ncbi:hypothetical protein E6A50_01915, partial [Brachyspira hampsonii]|nr:hypothetical protein [Brachyspira hampsonii]